MMYVFHAISPVPERKLPWNRCPKGNWGDNDPKLAFFSVLVKGNVKSTVLLRTNLVNMDSLWAALQMTWLAWASLLLMSRGAQPHTCSCYTSRHVTSWTASARWNISVCSELDTLLYITANSRLLISSSSDFPTADSNRSQKIRCDLDSEPRNSRSSAISATELFGTAWAVNKCSMLLHFLWYVDAVFLCPC